MHETGHVQQAQALQQPHHYLLELLRIVSLEYAHHANILLYLVDALALKELAFGLQQYFGEGATAQLKDQPQIILIFLHAVHAADAHEARVTLELGVCLTSARVIKQTVQLHLCQATLIICLVSLLLGELLDGELLARAVHAEPHDSTASFTQKIQLLEPLGRSLMRRIQLQLFLRKLNLAVPLDVELLVVVIAHVVCSVVDLACSTRMGRRSVLLLLLLMLRRRRLLPGRLRNYLLLLLILFELDGTLFLGRQLLSVLSLLFFD